MATTEEIKKLKQNWESDPIWDIEDTEGFEEHYEELKAFRKKCEAEWERKRQEQLIEKSIALGVPGNTELARYLDGLEYKIELLEKAIHRIQGI